MYIFYIRWGKCILNFFDFVIFKSFKILKRFGYIFLESLGVGLVVLVSLCCLFGEDKDV